MGAGSGGWVPPLTTRGLPPTLAERAAAEDVEALRLLGRVSLEATCQLGTVPGGFGDVHAGWLLAAQSCEAIGRPEDAATARALVGGPARAAMIDGPLPGDLTRLLQPALDVRVPIHGEELRFRFLHPRLLDAPALAPRTPTTPSGSVPVELAVRTTRWDPAAAEVRAPGAGRSKLADIETDAEVALSGWRASLEALPSESFEPSLRGVVNAWVRKTIYEALGAEQLETAPQIAVVLLEEAVGGVPRPRPGPGLDPVLMARVAFARWRAGEHNRAVELLRDIAAQPGWEVAQVAAEMVARVAVIPSATDARVRR